MAAIRKFDVIVIGGGSGGSGFAKRAAGYGKKVCIIEKGAVYDEHGSRRGAGYGGTCVNVGCVPKKIMYYAAWHKELFQGHSATAKGFGLSSGAITLDWAGLKKRRDAYVARLNTGYKSGWEKLGITVVEGEASFLNKNEVSVKSSSGTSTFSADQFLIVVGGNPKNLGIPGEDLVINSDGFFELEALPKKVAVIGSGYIGVEMAGILNALGSPTDLFCRGSHAMRHFDPFITDVMAQENERSGLNIVPNSHIAEVAKAGDGTLTIKCEEGHVHQGYDVVLAAIGRVPATKSLGLSNVGISTDQRGYIVVDDYEKTSCDNIFALGDVTNTGYELTPVAIAAGRRLADRLYAGAPKARVDYNLIPTVVFSHPPVGTMGLTEPEAVKKYGKDNVFVKKAVFPCMLYAFNDPEAKVRTGLKLVMQGPEERIVGLHIIGPFSDEILQGFAVAVRMGATRRDFEGCLAIHPTIGEELVTFGGWGQKDGKPWLPKYLLEGEESGEKATQPANERHSSSQNSEAGKEHSKLFWLGAGLSAGIALTAAAMTFFKPKSSL